MPIYWFKIEASAEEVGVELVPTQPNQAVHFTSKLGHEMNAVANPGGGLGEVRIYDTRVKVTQPRLGAYEVNLYVESSSPTITVAMSYKPGSAGSLALVTQGDRVLATGSSRTNYNVVLGTPV